MRYYTIYNDGLLIANNQEALKRYYDTPIFELPEDYEEGKYIIGEAEEEIEVSDYDEEGNPIIIEYEDTEVVIDYDEDGNPVGSHEITVIKHKQQTHTETVTVKKLIPNPNWDEEQLAEAKRAKYEEALIKAYDYQQNGTVEHKNCIFEMFDSNRKNLSDTEEALKLQGIDETTWLDKDDNLITLTVDDIQYIRLNLILAEIQKLWIVKYPAYKTAIAEATTVDEVNAIVIDYSSEEE